MQFGEGQARAFGAPRRRAPCRSCGRCAASRARRQVGRAAPDAARDVAAARHVRSSVAQQPDQVHPREELARRAVRERHRLPGPAAADRQVGAARAQRPELDDRARRRGHVVQGRERARVHLVRVRKGPRRCRARGSKRPRVPGSGHHAASASGALDDDASSSGTEGACPRHRAITASRSTSSCASNCAFSTANTRVHQVRERGLLRAVAIEPRDHRDHLVEARELGPRHVELVELLVLEVQELAHRRGEHLQRRCVDRVALGERREQPAREQVAPADVARGERVGHQRRERGLRQRARRQRTARSRSAAPGRARTGSGASASRPPRRRARPPCGGSRAAPTRRSRGPARAAAAPSAARRARKPRSPAASSAAGAAPRAPRAPRGSSA